MPVIKSDFVISSRAEVLELSQRMGLHTISHRVQKFVKKEHFKSVLANFKVSLFADIIKALDASPLHIIIIDYLPEGPNIRVFINKESIESNIMASGLVDKMMYEDLKTKSIRKSNIWTNLGSDYLIMQLKAQNQRPLRSVELTEASLPAPEQRAPLQRASIGSCASFSTMDIQATSAIIRPTVQVSVQVSLQSNGASLLYSYVLGVGKSDVWVWRLTERCAQAQCASEAAVQTSLNLPNKTWTQWQPQEALDLRGTELLRSATANTARVTTEAVHYNKIFNTHENDYTKLWKILNMKENCPADSMYEDIVPSFHEIVGSICCHAWHPTDSDILAAAYSSLGRKYHSCGEEHEASLQHKTLVWSLSAKEPLLYLLSPNAVTSLAFCPYNPTYVAAGCENGQIVIWNFKILSHINQKEKRISPLIETRRIHSCRITNVHWLPRNMQAGRSGAVLSEEREEMLVMTAAEDGRLLIWDCRALLHQQSNLRRSIQPLIQVQVNNSFCAAMLTASCVSSASTDALVREHSEIKISQAQSGQQPTLEEDTFNTKENAELKIFIGTAEGAVSLIDFNSSFHPHGEDLSKLEFGVTVSDIVHDGPVLSIVQSPFEPGLVLSVGGHTFAVWNHQCKAPLCVEHLAAELVSGGWSLHRRTLLYLTGENGLLLEWDLLDPDSGSPKEHHLCPGNLQVLAGLRCSQRSSRLVLTDPHGTIYMWPISEKHTQSEDAQEVFPSEFLSRDLPHPRARHVAKDTRSGLQLWREEESSFLSTDLATQPSRPEICRLEAEVTASRDVARSREARRRLLLLSHLPAELLLSKGVQRSELSRAQQPAVRLEHQQRTKQLLRTRKTQQVQQELARQTLNFQYISTKLDDVTNQETENLKLKTYLKDFARVEKEIITFNQSRNNC